MTRIALLGDRSTEFVTHRALDTLAERLRPGAELVWVPTEGATSDSLVGFDGVWVVPGTPYRDGAAVMEVLGQRRAHGLVTLGTCGGFQHMVVEFAAGPAGIVGAAHGETDPASEHAVVAALSCSLVGEVRTVTAVPGTRVAALCGTEPFDGFHFCSYGVDDRYRDALEAAGLVLSAFAPDAGVEAVELEGHPFYLGTLFQPQMSSADGGPVHPLVLGFVEACAAAA